MFLTIGDFDRDSNHDADCAIGDRGQTNGENKVDLMVMMARTVSRVPKKNHW